MNRWRAGLTRVDAVILTALGIIVVLLAILALLVMSMPTKESGRRVTCADNLRTIGKALTAYRNDNGGHFPLSWGSTDSGSGPANNAAASSLGKLYSQYITTAKPFRCPSSEDLPLFSPTGGDSSPCTVLMHTSYGYDPRMSRMISKEAAIMADMDGTGANGAYTITRNHDNGQNVLYADGHVQWVKSAGNNFASDNPQDNIFAQDPWDADTDTYLVRGDLNDLTISFDGYEHLK